MSERQNTPEKDNASKRPEQESEGAAKSMAPPAFALDASQGGAGGGGATPGADIGLGLDKKGGM
jgi:hypothetical protein